jgi:hypothetical protein
MDYSAWKRGSMNPIDKRKESAERQAVRLRNYQRIRQRALTRLAQNNPDQYRVLLEQERERDETEGKAWLDIHGRTSGSVGSDGHTAPKSTEDRPVQAISNGGEEGDLG